MNTPQLRINQQIQSLEVRLLREDGTQVGVVSKAEALAQAKQAGTDAVEIAPQANPPVVKLIDYKKYLYQLSKKDQAAKASAKKVDLKEVQLTPFMAANDFQTRLNRGREFLTTGNKVRLTVKFKGRQLSHKEFAVSVLDKAILELADIAVVDQPGKWQGKLYSGVLTPVKKQK